MAEPCALRMSEFTKGKITEGEVFNFESHIFQRITAPSKRTQGRRVPQTINCRQSGEQKKLQRVIDFASRRPRVQSPALSINLLGLSPQRVEYRAWCCLQIRLNSQGKQRARWRVCLKVILHSQLKASKK